MKTIDIKIELYIKDDDIEEIVEMAGYGIGYWVTEAEVIRNDENKIIGYNVLEDEEEKMHNLNIDDITRGIKYAIENGWNEIMDIDSVACENIDSEIADVIIQYACFNEIIYG